MSVVRWLIGAVVALLCCGLILVFDTTSAEMLDQLSTENVHTAVMKQMVLMGCGCAMGFGLIRLGWERLLRWAPLFFWGVVILLIGVWIPHFGRKLNGSHRWIYVMGCSFQPSEFLKYVLPLFFVAQWRKRWRAALFASVGLAIGLVLMEPDHGGTVLLLLEVLGLSLLMGTSWKRWAIPVLLCVGLGGAVAMRVPYVRSRLHTHFNTSDTLGVGYQPHQAKIATGSGGLFGKGLGASVQKLDYLPAARSDYIAAILGEEFGLMGMTVLLALYGVVLVAGLKCAGMAPTHEEWVVGVSLTVLIVFQACVNLGVSSALLPSKGIHLPFLSQGGSACFAQICAISVVLSLRRTECASC